jgi:hypothetical protein
LPLPALTIVPLSSGVPDALDLVPPSAGVGQVLGPGDRNLIVGRAANLRRWAARHLGRGRPVPKGRRPPTDLTPVATAVAYAATTSAFQQRLVYERLMARYVPLAARRDLKPPAFLHLEPAERFPRLSVRRMEGGPSALFGPFRDRRAAERAREALHKLRPLRPCDYSFEPDPALPLGLGCLFAQVRTCAAPCLVRIDEPDYRSIAEEVRGWLANPGARPEEVARVLPPWVASAAGRGLVVAIGVAGAELYPVAAGRVLDAASLIAPLDGWEGALDSLSGDAMRHAAPGAGDDWPWLTAWLATPAGRRSWVSLDDAAAPAATRTAIERAKGSA